MERTQELFEKIEEYLAKTLPEGEVIAFEKEMAKNPELMQEVNTQRDLHRVLSDTDTLDFIEKIRKIGKEVKQEQSATNKTSYFSYIKIAASIAILLGIGTFIWNNFDTKDKHLDLYLSHYSPYPTEDITRGDSVNKLHSILKNYRKGDYNSAIPELIKLTEPSISEKISLYLGNCYINTTGKEQEAIDLFESISDSSVYYEHATWYRALANLKKGNTKMSNEILEEIIQYNGIYKQQAIKLSKELTK